MGSLLFKLFLFQAFLLLAIVPHEVGHALVARWLGIKAQRIGIGFGPTLFSRRLFGVEVDIRSVPLGGITVLGQEAGRGRWLLTRRFLISLAGPSANLFLAATGEMLHPSSLWFSVGEPVHPVQLWTWANMLVAVENLVPFILTSSYGRIPSDGLAMLQILFLRKLPHAPAANVRQRQMARIVERVLQWLVAVLLFLCCLVCLALVGFVFTKGPLRLWGIAGFLLCLAATLAWLSWRALSAPLFQGTAGGSSAAIGSAALAELDQSSPWPAGLSPPVLAAEINDLVQTGKFDEALTTIDRHAAQTATNLTLDFWKAIVCIAAGRNSEAEAVLHELSQRPLSSTCQAELLVLRLNLVFKQGHWDRAASLVETFFGEALPIAVRVRVLDYLACVPFMEGHRRYLPEADRWSQELMALQPQNVTLKGTRGALLVEQGRFDDAEPLLNEVYEASESDIDRGISSLYLAIVAKHRSNHKEARRLAERARRTYRPAWLIQRIKHEFPDMRI